MCYTITAKYMMCKHEEKKTTRCEKYYEEKTRKEKSSKKGFWRSLFSSAPPPHKHTHGKQFIQDFCTKCSTENEVFKDLWRNEDEELEERNRKYAQKRVEKQNTLNRQSSQRKNFICRTCRAENRIPTAEARAFNSGLCCARGIQEFEERFEVTVYGRSNTRSRNPEANQKKAVSRSKTVPQLTSKQQMQRDASAASKQYGWKVDERDSSALDPQLVHDFLGLPGTGASALPPTTPLQKKITPPPSFAARNPPLREPQIPPPIHGSRARRIPVREDPTGINWQQWNHSRRTNHGRYPAPGPPPQAPLPIPPLRSKIGAKFSDSRQVLKREQSVKLSYDGAGYGPTEFSPVSPVSPVGQSRFDLPPQTLRHVATNLDGPLNEAYNAWNPAARTIPRKPLPRRR